VDPYLPLLNVTSTRYSTRYICTDRLYQVPGRIALPRRPAIAHNFTRYHSRQLKHHYWYSFLGIFYSIFMYQVSNFHTLLGTRTTMRIVIFGKLLTAVLPQNSTPLTPPLFWHGGLWEKNFPETPVPK
jgi:hypothetical protein